MSPVNNKLIDGQTVKPNSVVGLVYTLHDEDGELIEARTESDPLYYIHGQDQLLPAVESALQGKAIGFAAKIVVEPADGYGEYKEELVAEVDRGLFPSNVPLKLGMRFDTEGPKGEALVVEVIRLEGEKVTIDGNHPLAGVTLKFDLRVHSLRDATHEELSHGHVHGPGGHVH